jgi:hypothetical protein
MKKVTSLILAVASTILMVCGSARAAQAFDPMTSLTSDQPNTIVDQAGEELPPPPCGGVGGQEIDPK